MNFERRRWDSNPRYLSVSLVFKTSSLNHSDTSPYLFCFCRLATCFIILAKASVVVKHFFNLFSIFFSALFRTSLIDVFAVFSAATKYILSLLYMSVNMFFPFFSFYFSTPFFPFILGTFLLYSSQSLIRFFHISLQNKKILFTVLQQYLSIILLILQKSFCNIHV